MNKIVRLISYLKIIKKEFLIKIGLLLLISITYLMQAWGLGVLFQRVILGKDLGGMLWVIIFLITAPAVRSVITAFLETYSKKMGEQVKSCIRCQVMDKLVILGPQYINSQRSGKIQSVLLDGIEKLEPFLVNYLPLVISAAITATAVGVYICTVDVLTGCVLLVVMVLCLAVPYLTSPLLHEAIVGYWIQYTTMNAQYIDAIQGMTTLKAFHCNQRKGEELAEDAQEFYSRQIRNTSFSLIDSSSMIFLTGTVSIFIVGLAAWRAGIGSFPSEILPMFFFMAAECARPIADLNDEWHKCFLGLAAADHIFAVMDEPVKITQPDSPKPWNPVRPEIRFENVSFQYPGAIRPAIEKISMTIHPGERVAVVGMSGAGKSTLINLLFRFYDVSSGRITVDGVDIRDLDISALQKNIAVVFQENYVFSGTLWDNLKMADPNATSEDVLRAAKAAGVQEYAEKLPQGYDTELGERGMDLSGGQRQRLAIARAMLKKAPIMIFDEATSNVDAENESRITSAINNISRSATSIIIAHRLSTIKNVDRIFVFDDGRLVECGTHNQLIHLKGVYEKLIKAQELGAEQ